MTRASPPSCRSGARSGWLGRWRGGLAGVLLLGACHEQGAAPVERATAQSPSDLAGAGGAAPGEPGAAAPSVTPSVAPLVASAPRAPTASASAAEPGCRVVGVSGAATGAGQPLRPGATLGGAPLELGAGARLHLVHSASARAWSVEGPARLLACEGGAEELVVAYGTLRAEPGAGARPGAEVWVGTPYGAVRYADAGATLGVGERELALRVATGRVWFTPLGGAASEARAVTGAASFAAPAHRPPLARALERCGRDAADAEAHAVGVLAASPRPLGERAAEHVRARQRAHASCASARAAALAAPGEDPRPGAELARYDAQWRGVPGRGTSPRPAPP